MPSLKLKNHANKVQFKVKLINNESLNQRDINIMNSDVIRGIVIPQISGGKKLVYSLANVVDLKTFLSQPLTDNIKNIIFSKINSVLADAEQNVLNLNNLLLNETNVFVNPQTTDVLLIYLPIINPNDHSTFRYLLSSVMKDKEVKKLSVLGPNYRYLESVIGAAPLVYQNSAPQNNAATDPQMSIYGETTILSNESGKEADYVHSNIGNMANSINQNFVNHQSSEFSNFVGGPDAHAIYGATEPLDNDDANNDFPIETVTSLPPLNDSNALGVTEPLDYSNDNDMSQSQYDYYNSGNTVALDSFEVPTFAKLIIQKTGREYTIDKSEIYVGSSASDCDCSIDNGFISKRQLTVINEDGVYYAIDNGSTNGTTLNGNKMEPGMRYQLKDDDRLILANEIVDFKM